MLPIQLIRNANAKLSRLRCEKVIQLVNKSMLLMVKDNASYVEAFHDLFGLDFAKKSKEFIDNVKDLLPTTNIYNYEKKSHL